MHKLLSVLRLAALVLRSIQLPLPGKAFGLLIPWTRDCWPFHQK